MAERAGQFDEARLRAAGVEGMDDQAGLRRGIEPVRVEADEAEARLRRREGPGQAAAMILRYVIIVHGAGRSEEHTSELQSLMRISYAVFCLKKKKKQKTKKM